MSASGDVSARPSVTEMAMRLRGRRLVIRTSLQNSICGHCPGGAVGASPPSCAPAAPALPAAAKWVVSELVAAGKGDKLKGFEMVKAVHLESEAFSVDNDTLTPSFKLKRPQLQKKYQKEVDAMYVALGL